MSLEEKKLLNRLSRIEGQLRGIRRMVEEKAYCPDILMQVSAVSSALAGLNRELLSEHIKTCVYEDIKSGREDAAEELSDVIRRLMK